MHRSTTRRLALLLPLVFPFPGVLGAQVSLGATGTIRTSAPVVQAEKAVATEPVLDDATRAAFVELLAKKDARREDWIELERRVLAKDGEGTALVKALEAADASPDVAADGSDRHFAALRGLAWILHREGKMSAALSRVEAALALHADLDLALERAHLLDALGRAELALAAYTELEGKLTDPELAGHVALRRALLAMEKAKPPVQGEYSALFDLAAEPGRGVEFQDRAAIVLALLGRPREGLELYRPSGEGSDLFRQEIRVAEWALAAEAPGEAAEHAWKARAAATLVRDRSYALTVLVEAHRSARTLDALIARFAAEPELDDQSRHVWIDLLRETSRVDEAMQLFVRSSRGGFTPEMRRELLEMCREAGREDELVATYQTLIESEPERVEWRSGLARHWLERGQRERAEAVWKDFIAAHSDVSHRMQAARGARELGLDELARSTAESCFDDVNGRMEARLFLFDLEHAAGNSEAALAELEAFDQEASPTAPERVQLAEAFERAGNKRRAVDVLEGVREQRGGDRAEEDLEMRLAWLLSETGQEERALARWRNLWTRVSSVSRRRQVEDRLMAVASRLGVLADLAVELETKLTAGTADDRDAGLLVRLYTKVGDPVSAAEVIEEHLKKQGGDPVQVLEEQARVYLGGKDYFHFERAVQRLVTLDPERKGDHLRQLAMSKLERGRPIEARAVLSSLAECEGGSDAAEFEAGVLALAGLDDDALRAYRRGLAAHPERIDGYLLLANVMKKVRQGEDALGMFQYLAENADKDDLFTIAIDGLLNLRAKDAVLRWARRVTLERIARRHDKLYLYQLYCDLSEELEDTPGMLRALETSLAIAGEQRSALLRQMMDAAQGKQTNSYTVVNGVVQRGRSGGSDARRLAYGRRLIGLGDVVPPQVYLELGEAFLRGGDVANAAKTFSMARDVPDWGSFQRQIAKSFQDAGYVENALAVDERTLASQGFDPSLLLETAQFHEQLGRDARAAELYSRALDVLLAQRALTGSVAPKKPEDEESSWAPQNLDDFERYSGSLEAGWLATADDATLRAGFDTQRALFTADLAAYDKLTAKDVAAATAPKSGEVVKRVLDGAPRLKQRAAFLRRVALRTGWLEDAEAVDRELLARFPDDEELLDVLCQERAARGAVGAAVHLVEVSGRSPDERARALARLGRATNDSARGTLAVSDVVARLVPLLIEGDARKASLVLRSARLGATKKDDLPFAQLLVSAAVYVRDESSVAQLTHYALRTIVAHAQSWDDRERAVTLLDRARGVLTPEAWNLLVDGFVALVAADDKKLQDFQYPLSTLQEKCGRPLLSADVIKKRLDGCLPDNPYLLSTLLGLVPVESRLELLRPLWNKVPAAERAWTASSLLQDEETPRAPEYAAYLVDVFGEGIETIDDPASLGYPLQEFAGNERLPAGAAEILVERASKKWPDDAGFLALAGLCRAKRGDVDGALEKVSAALTVKSKVARDWIVRQTLQEIVTTLGAGRARRVLEELDRAEGKGASADAEKSGGDGDDEDAAPLAQMRIFALDLLGDEKEKRALLEKKLARKPDDAVTLQQLLPMVQAAGEVERELELTERLVRVDKKNPWRRNSLVAWWTMRQMPVRALAAKKEGDTDAAKTPDDAKKLAPATIAAVKKAVDENRFEDARTLYRRTWRSFHRDSPYRFSYGSWSNDSLEWPEKIADSKIVLPRGGLTDFTLDETDAEREKKQQAKTKRSAYAVIAEQPFGPGELERQVRSLSDSALQRSRSLLRGLELAEIARLGEDAAVRTWSDHVKSGAADTVERSLLLAWYEDHAEKLGEAERVTLGELAAAVHPLDSEQLRALARLYSKLGETGRATSLYKWCATLATGRRWFYAGDSGISARDLLEEVPEVLHGNELFAAVDAILQCADPRDERSGGDDYDELSISTWSRVVPPDQPGAARTHCEAQLARAIDPKNGLRRRAAIPAAGLYARLGDFDDALRAVEMAAARLPIERVKLDPRTASWEKRMLEPQTLDARELGRIIPPELDARQTKAWTARVVAQALAWEADKRLDVASVRNVLAAAALRLHGAGDDAAARENLDRLDARTRDLPRARQIVLDLARLLGDEDRARAIEDQLLATRVLSVGRVVEVLQRVRSTRGDEAAFELAAAASSWYFPRALADMLVDLSAKVGPADGEARVQAVASWTTARDAAGAAAKELELDW